MNFVIAQCLVLDAAVSTFSFSGMPVWLGIQQRTTLTPADVRQHSRFFSIRSTAAFFEGTREVIARMALKECVKIATLCTPFAIMSSIAEVIPKIFAVKTLP